MARRAAQPKTLLLYDNYDVTDFETRKKEWEADFPGEEYTEEMYWDDESTRADEFFDELRHFIENNKRAFIITGSVGRWTGQHRGGYLFNSAYGNNGYYSSLYRRGLWDAFKDCDYFEFIDDNGLLKIRCSHHDGTNYYEVRELTKKGEEYAELHEYDDDEEVHKVLLSSNIYTRNVHYAHRVFGWHKRRYGKAA